MEERWLTSIKLVDRNTQALNNDSSSFIKGADISSLIQMMEEGKKYYGFDGYEKSAFTLLKENGVNYIRLRLWKDPENVKESGGYCNLAQTIAFAKMMKEEGMKFFLDFHYSDWWADPGKQEKPKAWNELTGEDLAQAVYDYTYEVMVALKKEGVTPDMVQIGNEIRSGMLFPDGAVPNWECLADLVNAGIRAVREVSNIDHTQIVIHLDQGGRFYYFEEWFDQMIHYGMTDFDIIGLSYYPFWHGSFDQFKDTMTKLVDKYHKPLVVAETAHAWKRSEKGFIGKEQEKIAGFPATVSAQQLVTELVMNITASVRDGMGLGVFYWEPFMLPIHGEGGWGENMGVVSPEGKILESIKAFCYLPGDKDNNEVVKVYEPANQRIFFGAALNLPEKIKVLTWDGSIHYEEVIWKTNKEEYKIGCYEVTGLLVDSKRPVSVTIEVVNEIENNYNIISHGNFEKGVASWEFIGAREEVTYDLRSEFTNPFPMPPENYIYFKGTMNFTLHISQIVTISKAGKYHLSVDYLGDNTTGVDVVLFAKADKELFKTIIHPSDDAWTTYNLENLTLQAGKVQIGIRIIAPPIYGKIKNFNLSMTSYA